MDEDGVVPMDISFEDNEHLSSASQDGRNQEHELREWLMRHDFSSEDVDEVVKFGIWSIDHLKNAVENEETRNSLPLRMGRIMSLLSGDIDQESNIEASDGYGKKIFQKLSNFESGANTEHPMVEDTEQHSLRVVQVDQGRYYPPGKGPEHAIYGFCSLDKEKAHMSRSELEGYVSPSGNEAHVPLSDTVFGEVEPAKFVVDCCVRLRTSKPELESGWSVTSVARYEEKWVYNLQRTYSRNVEACDLRKKLDDGTFANLESTDDFCTGCQVWYLKKEDQADGKDPVKAILDKVIKHVIPYCYDIFLVKSDVHEDRIFSLHDKKST